MKTIIPVVKCEPVKLPYPTRNIHLILKACGYEVLDARIRADSYVMSNGLLTVFTDNSHHNITCDSFITESLSSGLYGTVHTSTDISRIEEAYNLLGTCEAIIDEIDDVNVKVQRFIGNRLLQFPESTMSAKQFYTTISDLVDEYLQQRNTEILNSIKLCPYIITPSPKAFDIGEDEANRIKKLIYSESLIELAYSNKVRPKDSDLLYFSLANDLHYVKFKVEGYYKAEQPTQPQPTTTKKKKWYQIF